MAKKSERDIKTEGEKALRVLMLLVLDKLIDEQRAAGGESA